VANKYFSPGKTGPWLTYTRKAGTSAKEYMNRSLLNIRSLTASALLLFTGLSSARCWPQTAIPDRPEKLSYPPLTYEPPAPEKSRVSLKSGPIAYVVPDRELPLVNIVVYAHTGSYLEPPARWALAELTGYLLARGGTKSKDRGGSGGNAWRTWRRSSTRILAKTRAA